MINLSDTSMPIQEGVFSKEEKISGQRRERTKDDELNETCKKVAKGVLFNTEASLVRFNTLVGSHQSLELIHIPSAPSFPRPETPPTDLDEPQEEIPRRTREKSERIAKVAHVTSRVRPSSKKGKRYSALVGKQVERRTQWIDPFQQEKKSLSSSWWKLFKEQLSSDVVPINNELNAPRAQQEAKGNICPSEKVINESIAELVDDLQRKNSQDRNEFLMQANAIENFLRRFIGKYAVESGLDLGTYKRAAQIKNDVGAFDSETDATYTYRIISERELNDLLNSIPLFLSHEETEVFLQEIYAKLV